MRGRALSRPILLGFILVAILGIFLRVYPSAGFTGLGYDEGLYRGYVTDLINHGVTSYPILRSTTSRSKETADRHPAADAFFTYSRLPLAPDYWSRRAPFTASRLLSVQHPLNVRRRRICLHLAGPVRALGVFALMSCAPTQIHMAQHALIDGFFAFWATLCSGSFGKT